MFINCENEKFTYQIDYNKEVMIIKSKTLPLNSVLKAEEKTFHYIDSYQCLCRIEKENYNSIKIGNLFLTSGPRWAEKLMKIRDYLVTLFGLKTSERNFNDDHKFILGEQIGIFKLFSLNDKEIILGENDKHLDFKVSILFDNIEYNTSVIKISTVVTYNNWFGKLYFIAVRPFHQLIVKATLKNMISKLENDQ